MASICWRQLAPLGWSSLENHRLPRFKVCNPLINPFVVDQQSCSINFDPHQLFFASPVLQLKDIIANNESPSVAVRTIGLPGVPYMLALSCDHSMLSVCYTDNGLSFLDIFAVQSFLSNVCICQMTKRTTDTFTHINSALCRM